MNQWMKLCVDLACSSSLLASSAVSNCIWWGQWENSDTSEKFHNGDGSVGLFFLFTFNLEHRIFWQNPPTLAPNRIILLLLSEVVRCFLCICILNRIFLSVPSGFAPGYEEVLGFQGSRIKTVHWSLKPAQRIPCFPRVPIASGDGGTTG